MAQVKKVLGQGINYFASGVLKYEQLIPRCLKKKPEKKTVNAGQVMLSGEIYYY